MTNTVNNTGSKQALVRKRFLLLLTLPLLLFCGIKLVNLYNDSENSAKLALTGCTDSLVDCQSEAQDVNLSIGLKGWKYSITPQDYASCGSVTNIGYVSYIGNHVHITKTIVHPGPC